MQGMISSQLEEVCLVADELRECHKDMDRKKAVGIDGITKEDYEAKLEENLENLERQLKQKYKKLYPDRPLPHITPHVFHHTFCTNMANAGMDIKTLQYVMGHSDVGVTLNVIHMQALTGLRSKW